MWTVIMAELFLWRRESCENKEWHLKAIVMKKINNSFG